jgi:hypothetical protein
VGGWFGYCAGTRYERASGMSVRTIKRAVFRKAVTLLYEAACAQVREVVIEKKQQRSGCPHFRASVKSGTANFLVAWAEGCRSGGGLRELAAFFSLGA